jgi:Ca2+-binding EF-hand superfamily protein
MAEESMIKLGLSDNNKQVFLAMFILLGFCEPVFAGGRAAPANEDQTPATQTLDDEISIEDRVKLRRALDTYSRTDPSHNQLELRRRAMRKQIQERFFGADQDNDGTLSREEAIAALPQISRHFEEIDFNGDNIITMKELEEAQARVIERRHAAEARIDEARLNENKEAELQLKRKGKQAAIARKGSI